MPSLKLSLFVVLFLTLLNANEKINEDREISVRKAIDSVAQVEEKDVKAVNSIKEMFSEGKVSGQVRSIYAGYSQEAKGEVDAYATAIGGMLKYELASFNGFNAAIALRTSQDISFATGSGVKQNPELSSHSGDYTELTQAYLNYRNGGLNIRLGRQLLDTPLADTDDIRMIPNTFEAYMMTYEKNNFTFTLGNVQKWQGVDTGLGYNENGDKLDSNWVDTGSRCTWMSGITYEDTFLVNAWYYNISKEIHASDIGYFDIGNHSAFGDTTFHYAAQYLYEKEQDNSGVEADIYGALIEYVYYGLGFNLAYNKSLKHKGKRSFSGIGGGSLYTSMDTMIIDEITEDREAEAIVAGLVYGLVDWSFLYAYGDFRGDANSAGEKAHIVEQNIGFEYSTDDALTVAAIYVKEENKIAIEKSINDWDRLQILVKYDF